MDIRRTIRQDYHDGSDFSTGHQSRNHPPLGPNAEDLAMIVQQTADNVMITDRNGNILYVNPSFERNTGYCLEEIKGRTPNVLKSGKQKPLYYKKLWATILSGHPFRAVVVNKKKSGELYYADQTITPIKDSSGKIIRFVSVWKDVSEKMRMQHQLLSLKTDIDREKKKLEEILELEQVLNGLLELNQIVNFALVSACRLLSASRCSIMLIDEKTNELIVKGSIGIPVAVLETQIRIKIGDSLAGRVAQGNEPCLVSNIETDQRYRLENRESYHKKSFICAPIKLGDKTLGVLNVAEKVSSERFTELDLKVAGMISNHIGAAIRNAQVYNELRHTIKTDPVTEIFNFRYFVEKLDDEILRADRFHQPLSLLMLDVDDFQSINDRFGRPLGDRILKDLADNLKRCTRDVDFVFRYAGDEFAIILPHTSVLMATKVAEKIISKLRDGLSGTAFSVSIGVAGFNPGTDRRDFVLKADTALYQAKHQDKDKICCLP